MMTDSKSDEPEDLIEPLPGKEYNQQSVSETSQVFCDVLGLSKDVH